MEYYRCIKELDIEDWEDGFYVKKLSLWYIADADYGVIELHNDNKENILVSDKIFDEYFEEV